MKKWFERCSVQTKLILSYTVLALVPMLVIAVYTYFNTRDILLDSLYEDLSAQLERTGKNLDEKLGNYYAVSNILYMDNTLQSYLTVDYSEKGFEDLYDYVDGLFSSILTFYPEISRISLYSSNETLPEDDFYFYYLDQKELPGWYADASRAGGILHMEAEDNGIIGFTRQMNLYELGKYELFVKLWVPQEALNQMLDIGDEQVTLALIGEDGLVEASNQTSLIGACLDTESMDNQIVMRGEVDYGGTLVMYTDSRRFNASAEQAAKRIFGVFLASMGMAMAAKLFGNVAKAAELLGVENDPVPQRGLEAMKRFPPYRMGKYGQLLEWYEDYEECTPGMGHISHMYPVYPGNLITQESAPELMEAARRSLERRMLNADEQTGWPGAWRISLMARFHNSLECGRILKQLGACLGANLFTAQMQQIDAIFGTGAGIAEMLLQSHQGYVEIIPAITVDWAQGSFRGLRARGGFCVSAAWNRGRLYEAQIESLQGGVCRVKAKGLTAVEGGQGRAEAVDSAVEFETEKGQVYQLIFGGQ